MMFTPKLPILLGLTALGLIGCTANNPAISLTTTQKGNTAIERPKQTEGRTASKEIKPSTLSEITYSVSELNSSDEQIEKALNETVTFLENIETEKPTKKDMLKLYHYGEVLKKVGPDKNAATINEIGNWMNTYLRSQLLDEEGLTVEEILEYRDGLIEQANRKWSELQNEKK